MWSLGHADRAVVVVDVADEQLAEFGEAERVEQGEQPDEGLVGMHGGIAGPTAEQAALLTDGERLALEASLG